MIEAGTSVIIEKGCKARNVLKGSHAYVREVTELGADYGHSVRVVIGLGSRSIAFYARHKNRLSDPIVSLNDGNPLHKIQIRKRR